MENEKTMQENAVSTECEIVLYEPDKPRADGKLPTVLEREMVLECALTQEERLAKAQEIVESQQRIDNLELDRKIAAKRYAAEIVAETKNRDAIIESFTTGKESRSVLCYVVLNSPADGLKEIYRSDTRERVSVEQMTNAELDQDLPGIVEDADADETECEEASDDE